MKQIDAKVQARIKEFGFQPEDLTPKELRELEQEVAAIERGECVLDGVLYFKRRV